MSDGSRVGSYVCEKLLRKKAGNTGNNKLRIVLYNYLIALFCCLVSVT